MLIVEVLLLKEKKRCTNGVSFKTATCHLVAKIRVKKKKEKKRKEMANDGLQGVKKQYFFFYTFYCQITFLAFQ